MHLYLLCHECMTRTVSSSSKHLHPHDKYSKYVPSGVGTSPTASSSASPSTADATPKDHKGKKGKAAELIDTDDTAVLGAAPGGGSPSAQGGFDWR